MPATFVTASPLTGETNESPWMSWICSAPGTVAPPPLPEVPESCGVGVPVLKSVAFPVQAVDDAQVSAVVECTRATVPLVPLRFSELLPPPP